VQVFQFTRARGQSSSVRLSIFFLDENTAAGYREVHRPIW
jgi:hypothetical protein